MTMNIVNNTLENNHEVRETIWPEIQRLIREIEAEAEFFRPFSKIGKAVNA